MIAALGIEFWPFLVPIFGIMFGCGIAVVAIWTSYQRRKHLFELFHQERMAAIDKGVEVPPLPDAFLSEDARPYSPRRNLLKGLIWLFVGLGALAGLFGMHEDALLFALIPVGIGLAYLIYYFAVGRKEAELLEAAERAKLAETNRASRG